MAEYVAGCRMPSDRGIAIEDANTRTKAGIANERFLHAVFTYGARNGGLPNISQEECRRRLGPERLPAPRPRPQPHKKRCIDWTPEEDALALHLSAKGRTPGQIALRLPRRNRDAVAGRLRYLRKHGEAGR